MNDNLPQCVSLVLTYRYILLPHSLTYTLFILLLKFTIINFSIRCDYAARHHQCVTLTLGLLAGVRHQKFDMCGHRITKYYKLC
jgi:hypothetical protein